FSKLKDFLLVTRFTSFFPHFVSNSENNIASAGCTRRCGTFFVCRCASTFPLSCRCPCPLYAHICLYGWAVNDGGFQLTIIPYLNYMLLPQISNRTEFAL